MMKTRISFIALICVMVSLAQPAWSMEERPDLGHGQSRKRPNPQKEPDQGNNKEEEPSAKIQKVTGEEQSPEEVGLEQTSEEVVILEALYPYLEKRWELSGDPFDTTAKMKFRDEVDAKNPPAIRLMLKALLDWERDLKRKSFLKKQQGLPTDHLTNDEKRVKELLKKYFGEIDSKNPYDVAFRYKHADTSLIHEEDEQFLCDAIEESDDLHLIYKIAPVLMQVKSTPETIGDAAYEINELSLQMLDEPSKAEQGFTIRHKVKMCFRNHFAKMFLGEKSDIDFSSFKERITILLQPDHPDNSTPHQFYKSLQLALKYVDSLYWKSFCDDLWIDLLPTIEQLVPETLRKFWIPADLNLCLYYAENEGKSLDPLGMPNFTYNFPSWSRSLNRERADFYRRRAVEKKYNPDSIPSELKAYLEHTYRTLIENPPYEGQLGNIMVDLAGKGNKREINKHVGWMCFCGVGVKQDENEGRRRFQLASGRERNMLRDEEKAAKFY